MTGTIGVYRLLSKNQSSIAVAALIIGAGFLLVTVSLTVLMQIAPFFPPIPAHIFAMS